MMSKRKRAQPQAPITRAARRRRLVLKQQNFFAKFSLLEAYSSTWQPTRTVILTSIRMIMTTAMDMATVIVTLMA
jgi:hypothetical protein